MLASELNDQLKEYKIEKVFSRKKTTYLIREGWGKVNVFYNG
jgi:hypothetical protein